MPRDKDFNFQAGLPEYLDKPKPRGRPFGKKQIVNDPLADQNLERDVEGNLFLFYSFYVYSLPI